MVDIRDPYTHTYTDACWNLHSLSCRYSSIVHLYDKTGYLPALSIPGQLLAKILLNLFPTHLVNQNLHILINANIKRKRMLKDVIVASNCYCKPKH